MIYHLMALVAASLLDLLIGDPMGWPHPVRWIGALISALSEKFIKRAEALGAEDKIKSAKKKYGLYIVIIVVGLSGLIVGLLMFISYRIDPIIGLIVETIISYQCMAAKSLYKESMKVYKALKVSIEDARRALSMIVGRDTDSLDRAGVIKAAVETVAENSSDGVIAPLIYLGIGGPVLGIMYKAANTIDSMIGYKNDKYIDLGHYGARFDDLINYIPSRISAWAMIYSCIFLGNDYSYQDAKRIYIRDRYCHASPNSAQTESVCAGALGVRLAGPASYFGNLVDKPYIGDAKREVEEKDIIRANRLMFAGSILVFAIILFILDLIVIF